VPRHWSQKRKYLQGKRGLEKPPFKLPDFIEATGEEKGGGLGEQGVCWGGGALGGRFPYSPHIRTAVGYDGQCWLLPGQRCLAISYIPWGPASAVPWCLLMRRNALLPFTVPPSPPSVCVPPPPKGITEMRNAYMEKEEAKKLKQKQRDRMSAKTGKMDIAYEVRSDLHTLVHTLLACSECTLDHTHTHRAHTHTHILLRTSP